jgi:Rieske 2Fe-2S family protein
MDAWIDELAAAQQPGWSLDAPFYTDPAVFQRDRKHIFDRQWLMAGHIAQIPNRGDYFLFDYAGDNIIVIRGPDDTVHAHFNVCRHRGGRVLLEPTGNAASMTCTYHGWNYAQDGSLRVAPRMAEDFDPGCFGLRGCAVTLLEGLIFICPAKEQAPKFEEVHEGLAPFLQLHGCATASIAVRRVFPVAANWKLVTENYLECYHCKPAHPEYCVVEAKADIYADGSAAGIAAYEKREREWLPMATERGTFLPEYNSVANSDPGKVYFGAAYRAPLRDSHLTGSKGGQPVAPLLEGFSEYDWGETSVSAGPCSYMLAYNDYMTFFQFVPRDATHTDMIVTWLVAGDAVAGRDYDPEAVSWLWDVTSVQDKTIIENNAAGIATPAYTPGPPSLLEDDVVGFREWYLATIAPGTATTPAREPESGRYFPA